MLTHEGMKAAAYEYARCFSAGEREAWLDLFVEEPAIIEPADSAPRGREALERSFDGAKAAGMRVALEPLRVIANGRDVAMHMRVRATIPGGSVSENSVIEIFTFADDGRIAWMRTFVDPEQLL